MPDSATSLENLKQSMRAAWMAGDFGVVAKTVASGAEEFVGRLSIPAGARVLDVACGTGNQSLPLARRGYAVTGVDIATNLLEQARHRAAAEALTVSFVEGDAEDLPFPDASFDAVVSMFGAMFAPRPEIVASEFARVLKPGGLLAMANWTPTGFSGQMFRVSTQHVPPPAMIAPPVLWGDDKAVRARLAPFFVDIQTQVVGIDFDLAVSPAGAVDFFRQYFGPTRVAFSRLDEVGQKAMASDLESLWASANRASDPETHTSVDNEYLQVLATRTISN